MKKKGFTLIELLAVIVILAIIALIATPAVLNIIEDSRKSGAEASARNIASTAETYYMSNLAKGETTSTIDLSKETLKYNGDQATKGYLKFDNNGNASGKMYVGGYCVTHNVDNTITSTKISEDECEIVIPYTTYKNGAPLYFNPTTGLKCKASEAVSTIGTNNGCMKWYAFLDSESSEKIKLQLDHDTVIAVDWYDGSLTGEDVTNLLLDTAVDWKEVVNGVSTNIVPRTISRTEVHQIVQPNAAENDYYNFHTGNTTETYIGAAGTNKYAWLFDNMRNCTTYGCNVGNENDSWGYMTSDYVTGAGYFVNHDGSLSATIFSGTDGYAMRPVIEVSKAVFE